MSIVSDTDHECFCGRNILLRKCDVKHTKYMFCHSKVSNGNIKQSIYKLKTDIAFGVLMPDFVK
jgi:hypothetical protein